MAGNSVGRPRGRGRTRSKRAKGRNSPGPARFRIVDRGLLASEIELALRRFGYPKEKLYALAARAGIPKSTLYQLVAGQREEIHQETLDALTALVPRNRHQVLLSAFLSPVASALLDGYKDWLAESVSLHDDGITGRWTSTYTGVARLPRDNGGRAAERSDLLRQLRREFPGLFAEFDKMIAHRGHLLTEIGRQRVDLAIARVLDPLVEAREAGFIEFYWWTGAVEAQGELSDGMHTKKAMARLKKLISLGLERERILLDRPHDVVRAQEIAEIISRNGKLFREPYGVAHPLSWLSAKNGELLPNLLDAVLESP